VQTSNACNTAALGDWSLQNTAHNC